MKLSIKFSLVIAALLVACSTYATEINPEFIIKKTGTKSFYLNLKNSQAKEVQISIHDENKHVLVSEATTDPSHFNKKFNLSKLPKGAYFLMLEDEEKIQIQPLTILKEGLVIESELQKKIYKPVVLFKNGLVDLTMISMEKNKVKVKITDGAFHTLYEEEVNQSRNLHKRFDVSKLAPGTYTFFIRVNGRSFEEVFVVDEVLKKFVGAKTFYFDGKDMASKIAEVKINDENGSTLFSEYVPDLSTFERNYNLSELPNGTYFLLVEGESETKEYVILIESEGLKMNKKKGKPVQ